jgi:hypothetical protein
MTEPNLHVHAMQGMFGDRHSYGAISCIVHRGQCIGTSMHTNAWYVTRPKLPLAVPVFLALGISRIQDVRKE